MWPEDAEKTRRQAIKKQQGRQPLKGRTVNEYKIMIVDDEPDILDLLEKALAKQFKKYRNFLKTPTILAMTETSSF